MFYMSRKSYGRGIASVTALLSQALLILLLSATILGAGDLVANEYGEIDETPMGTEPATQEEVLVPATDSEEVKAEDGEALGPTEPEEASDLSDEAIPSGDGAVETNTSETVDSTEAEEIEEEAKPTMAEAVVYVFNNDDDTLSVSLFIDSELKDTEDVSKDKEKKFGNYELLAGSHGFKITWWDDDTKKTHEEELVATVEDETAVTLYTTQNKEPEEFEVNVMLRNENQEDLEAYLYIDGEYEKQKTAKKESTTDFGKFDLEEGTHELAVRWQDSETKIEYEKRKTVRVDGKDAVTFYAPQGMTFESEEKADSKATTTKTTTSNKTATTSTKTTSTTTKDDEEKDPSSEIGVSDANQASSNSGGVGTTADRGTAIQEKRALSDSEPTPDEKNEGEGTDLTSTTLYISTIGAILLIYIIFFRR
jgi:hypothetical protein